MSRERQVPVEVRLGALAWQGAADVCTLFVPFEIAESSANRSLRMGHTIQVQKERRDVAHLAAAWAYREAGEPTTDAPVVVDVIFFRARLMDDVNALTGLKAVQDWLFKGRVTPDDSRRWLASGMTRWVTGDRWAKANAWNVLIVRKRGPHDEVSREKPSQETT